MQSQQVPDELIALRDEIDRIDDELVSLLAQRFGVTAKVGELKASAGLVASGRGTPLPGARGAAGSGVEADEPPGS